MALGIKKRREEKGISQYDLAASVGMTQSQISKIESGKRNVKANELLQIAQALDSTVEELFLAEK